jgi:hypothetical protein
MNGTLSWPTRVWAHLPAQWRLAASAAVVALYVVLGGCATWQAPQVVDAAGVRSRAVSESKDDVRLSAAVLGADDSRRLFGADVNARGIQPVWVEVENSSPDTLWLLRAGTDPDYFSPLEVAWLFHRPMADTRNAEVDEHFGALDFRNPIPPDSTRAGIIFTNRHHRTRVLNVDLLGRAKMIPFTLFLSDPDNPPDAQALQAVARQAATPGVDLDDFHALRDQLERLPCCAEDGRGVLRGDPLNVVLVGWVGDIAAALVRRGFRSDRRDFDDDQRLFGRPPDLVLRKASQGGAPANWIRGWVSPLRYKGRPVFLAQTGRPVGGRFAVAEGEGLVLNADVDEARNLLIQDLMYSGGLARLGFSGGVGPVPVAQPQHTRSGGQYFTDGLRAVLFFAARPRAVSQIQRLDWIPALERREAAAALDQTDARE